MNSSELESVKQTKLQHEFVVTHDYTPLDASTFVLGQWFVVAFNIALYNVNVKSYAKVEHQYTTTVHTSGAYPPPETRYEPPPTQHKTSRVLCC